MAARSELLACADIFLSGAVLLPHFWSFMTTAIAELWFAVAGDDDRSASAWQRARLGGTGAPGDAEAALLVRIRAGDDGAFTDVYVTYVPRLTAYAQTYVRDAVSAEELVHDVLASIWEGRTRLQVRGSLVVYLYGAVRFAALKRARDTGVRDRYGFAAASEDSRRGTDPNGDDETQLWERRRAAVLRAVDELPPRCREAFVLRWRDELSYAEIGAVMGISIKTVEMQMTIAVKRLREQLAGQVPD